VKRLLLGTLACACVFAACSADKTDFKKSAEKTIIAEVDKQLHQTVTADCAQPSSTDVGTTFTCTATAADGTTMKFSAKITKKNEVSLTLIG
jgi:hypothetical protein